MFQNIKHIFQNSPKHWAPFQKERRIHILVQRHSRLCAYRHPCSLLHNSSFLKALPYKHRVTKMSGKKVQNILKGQDQSILHISSPLDLRDVFICIYIVVTKMLVCNASTVIDTRTLLCSILSPFTSDHFQTISPVHNHIFNLIKMLAGKRQTL